MLVYLIQVTCNIQQTDTFLSTWRIRCWENSVVSARSHNIVHFDNWMHKCACRHTHDETMWVNERLKCKLLRKWLWSCVSGKECVREWVVGRERKWVAGEWNENGICRRGVGMCLRKWREILLTYLYCRLPCTSFNMKVIRKEINPNFEARSRTLICKRAWRKTKLDVIGPLTFRHRASSILGQAFRYSTENALYIFNQQIYFIIWYLLDRASLI